MVLPVNAYDWLDSAMNRIFKDQFSSVWNSPAMNVMDDEKIMQIDVPEVDMDGANSDLNNILFKSVTQSVDDLAEAIIEQLLVDERFKKIFKQPRDNDQRKERRLLSRQKNKEQQYLLLEDLVAQDNKGLASSIKADQFAKEVDFFSIGTNDLIQYTMAADRMNEQVSYLYQPYNPSILRLINNVIKAAHAEGKWAGMCGEMAGDQTAVPLLVGMGLDEFSMSATSVLRTRSLMKKLDTAKMEEYANRALTECSTMEEVLELSKEYVNVD